MNRATAMILTICCSVTAGCSAPDSGPTADALVQRFHRDLEAGTYSHVHVDAHKEFRHAVSDQEAQRFFHCMNDNLGQLMKTDLVSSTSL